MSADRADLVRRIPSVDAVLGDPRLKSWTSGMARRIVVDSVRAALDETRKLLLAGQEGEVTQEVWGGRFWRLRRCARYKKSCPGIRCSNWRSKPANVQSGMNASSGCCAG